MGGSHGVSGGERRRGLELKRRGKKTHFEEEEKKSLIITSLSGGKGKKKGPGYKKRSPLSPFSQERKKKRLPFLEGKRKKKKGKSSDPPPFEEKSAVDPIGEKKNRSRYEDCLLQKIFFTRRKGKGPPKTGKKTPRPSVQGKEGGERGRPDRGVLQGEKKISGSKKRAMTPKGKKSKAVGGGFLFCK